MPKIASFILFKWSVFCSEFIKSSRDRQGSSWMLNFWELTPVAKWDEWVGHQKEKKYQNMQVRLAQFHAYIIRICSFRVLLWLPVFYFPPLCILYSSVPAAHLIFPKKMKRAFLEQGKRDESRFGIFRRIRGGGGNLKMLFCFRSIPPPPQIQGCTNCIIMRRHFSQEKIQGTKKDAFCRRYPNILVWCRIWIQD